MLTIIRLFFRNKEANPYIMIFCMLMSSLAEAIGIGSLIPVIALATGSSESQSPLAMALWQGFERAGITPTLGALVVLVALFMLLKALLAYMAMAYAAKSASHVALQLRRKLIVSVLKARWSYFSEQRSGRITNILARETLLAAEAYVAIAAVVAASVQVVAYALIAVAISPPLAATSLAAGLFVSVVLQHYVKVAQKAGYQQVDRTIMLMSNTVDLLANIKPLKAMNRQQAALETIQKLSQKMQNAFLKKELSKAGLTRGSEALKVIAAAVGIYLANTFLRVPFADLVVSVLIFSQILTILSKLQRMHLTAVTLESSYVRSIEAIEEAQGNEEVNPGQLRPDAGNVICRFEDVDFAHGERPILRKVSLEIAPKMITVLSGPSGSGKTTIVDLLLGLHKATSGLIMIGQHPISEVDLHAWRGQIGYVPQELTLFHESIRMNLTLGDPSISDEDIARALEQAGATDFVQDMPQGLDTDVGEMGSKLSGGQRQRLSLARALVMNPKLLVLDEVTSALDPETEAEIIENVALLSNSYTIVAITHRPAWAAIADKIYRVSDGDVAEECAGHS